MAKINLNDAFLTTKVKNDTEIERATTKNINRISQTDIQEIHQNLMRVLNIKIGTFLSVIWKKPLSF